MNSIWSVGAGALAAGAAFLYVLIVQPSPPANEQIAATHSQILTFAPAGSKQQQLANQRAPTIRKEVKP
jgi:hypothetical protein